MQEPPRPIDRRRLSLLLAPIVALTAANTVGTALAPALLVKAPLALVALSPLGRHLVLASSSLDPALFFAVAGARMFVGDPFMYLLGREYGDQAIEAVASHLGGAGEGVRLVDRLFRRASWLAVLLWPGPLVCALAGAARLPVGLFVSLNLAGTFLLLGSVRWFSAELAGPVGWLRALLEDNTTAATVVSVGVVAATLAARLVRRPAAPAPVVAPGAETPRGPGA